MKDRPFYRKCAIDRVGLAFVALVATSSALLADDLTQPTAAAPIVGTELESLVAVPLDSTIAIVAVDAAVPSGTSPQSELIRTPSGTALDATVEGQFRSDFNDLRRELLEDRMKLVDWWLTAAAIFLTLFAVIIAIAGLVGFRRFREIESEARKRVESANAAVEVAKVLVQEIESKRDEAKSLMREITAETVVDDPDKAEKATQSANADPSPVLIDQAISAAIEMQRLRDFEGAIEKWQGVATVADGADRELGARAWFSVGYLHTEEFRFSDAIANYDVAIKLKPDFAEAFSNRGNAKNELGHHAAAISDLNEAIRIDPNLAGAYVNRGNVKHCLGRHTEAISDYDEAIRLNLHLPESFCNRGIAKSRLGRYAEAISDYDEAIRLKPDYAEAFYNRGTAKHCLDRHVAAISDYDEAIRLNLHLPESFCNRGIAKSRLGRYAEAISDYDEAIRLKPDDASLYCERAQAFFHFERVDEARQDLESAHGLATAKGDQLVVEKVNELVEQLFGGEAP